MGSEIMFYCFSCKNPAQNFSSNPNSLESSSQVSIKTPRADYASRYSATLNQIESDSKSLPKFDLKARKSIMEEFFEGEDKATTSSYSWVATCKLCRRDNSSTKSRQG
ncbi:hypothetical protein DSO57_1034429 [Entomophthora muscae]|uniref:Uncharacterized protein n=1 Tax=Entomophthora muscae TaxID=34485 RepID=A0ACC2ULT6_9FUNG|nr:hypothetical protein DSO57_1034429 [Entomophthora muscae]